MNGADRAPSVTICYMADADDTTSRGLADELARLRADLEDAIRTSHANGTSLNDLAAASGLTIDEIRRILDNE